MSDESCKSIEIVNGIPFFGKGDTLENRLRNVRLRGFPDVRIYENADFEVKRLSSEEIPLFLQTPQLNVYETHLSKIDLLCKLFQNKGIDILHLNKAYDFLATSESNEITEWTMAPPVVERFFISNNVGNVDYGKLIGKELMKKLNERKLGINPQIFQMKHPTKSGWVNEINDGSHRIHHGFELGKGVTILLAKDITSGFPYYAVPQEYSLVNKLEKEDSYASETKIHIIDAPGHKDLYRLFPSGGIKSGAVRFDPKLKD